MAALAVEAAQGGFTAAGGGEAYLIVSLADVPNRMPFGVIPVAKASDAAALARALRPLIATPGTAPPGAPLTTQEALQRSLALVCEPLGGVVFVGPAATLDRLKKLPDRGPRPDGSRPAAPPSAEEIARAL